MTNLNFILPSQEITQLGESSPYDDKMGGSSRSHRVSVYFVLPLRLVPILHLEMVPSKLYVKCENSLENEADKSLSVDFHIILKFSVL